MSDLSLADTTKSSVLQLPFAKQMELLQQIHSYKTVLEEREDHLEDTISLQHPEQYKNIEGVMAFGGGVPLRDVLSFLHQLDGKIVKNID